MSLANAANRMQLASLRSLAIECKTPVFMNGTQITFKDHPLMDDTAFLPAFQDAILRMEQLQMKCDVTVNNGSDPSDGFVQAMKLLWRQPLHLSPIIPRATVSFPTITDIQKPLEMHIQLPYF